MPQFAVSTVLFTYLLGGVTFIPALVLLAFLHFQYTAPIAASHRNDPNADSLSPDSAKPKGKRGPDNDDGIPVDLPEELRLKLKVSREREEEEGKGASGYFTIYREWPGTIDWKDNASASLSLSKAGEDDDAGTVGALPKSLGQTRQGGWQGLYKSLFDRNKTSSRASLGSLMNGRNESSSSDISGKSQGSSAQPMRSKSAVYFVVLRLGHLILYDSDAQLEVRRVISLEHHNIEIYGGPLEPTIPESELFVKRNCLRLYTQGDAKGLDRKEHGRDWFLFTENASDKEDFYHALLANKESTSKTPEYSPHDAPRPLMFEQDQIIRLVQQLHSSSDALETRWFNALISRLFLSLQKTPEMKSLVRFKIEKKISRVQKPSFLHEILVGGIDLGNAAPMITNPKLREITMSGDVVVECDVRYSGGFRLDVAAIARIDLGKRLGGVRSLNLLLAVILRKLEGHMLFRIKPPPTNRIWFSFEQAPKVELGIEPVVSNRQITYGWILRAIESRIREVLAETIVSPNWDDIPFFETLHQRQRGGIWQEPARTQSLPESNADPGALLPLPGDGEAASEGERYDSTSTEMPSTASLVAATMASTSMSRNDFSEHERVSIDSMRQIHHRHSLSLPSKSSRDSEAALSSATEALPRPSRVKRESGDHIVINKPEAAHMATPQLSGPVAAHIGVAAVPNTQITVKERQPDIEAQPSSADSASISRSIRADATSEDTAYTKANPYHVENAVEPNVKTPNALAEAKQESARKGFSEPLRKVMPAKTSDISGFDRQVDDTAQPDVQSSSTTHLQALHSGADVPLTKRLAGRITSIESAKEPSSGTRLTNVNKKANISLGAAAAAAKSWGIGVLAARQQNGAKSFKQDLSSDAAVIPTRNVPSRETDDVLASPGMRDENPSHSVSRRQAAGSDELETPLTSSSASHGLARSLSGHSSTSSLSSDIAATTTNRSSRIPTPTFRNSERDVRRLPSPGIEKPNAVRQDSISSAASVTGSPHNPPQQSHAEQPRLRLSFDPNQFDIAPHSDEGTSKPARKSLPGPIGRGQPLPPPGTPLPSPRRNSTLATAVQSIGGMVAGSMRRKPIGNTADRAAEDNEERQSAVPAAVSDDHSSRDGSEADTGLSQGHSRRQSNWESSVDLAGAEGSDTEWRDWQANEEPADSVSRKQSSVDDDIGGSRDSGEIRRAFDVGTKGRDADTAQRSLTNGVPESPSSSSLKASSSIPISSRKARQRVMPT